MIIGDSSALITLALIDKLELLEQLYLEVYVPQAVYDEVTSIDKPYSDKLKSFLQPRVKSVDSSITKIGLGEGELEAIVLYKELNSDLLLIDDSRAKKFAIINGIKVIGSLGVLIDAKNKGLIQEIKPYLEMIVNSQIYISNKLIQKVLEICNE
jgi:predicted nucleic acid-binding protein